MAVPDFTVVLGVDGNHLEHLRLVWPTWVKFKPSLLNHPLVIFYDHFSVRAEEIAPLIKEHKAAQLISWPSYGITHESMGSDRFGDAQRYKMLAGFVHIPSKWVDTKYWLKIDLDSVATGQDDWIDEKWFEDEPSIIAPSWNYTKPPDQIEKLDEWVDLHQGELPYLVQYKPLDLHPEPGSSLVRHKRIISWVSFFNTKFTALCSVTAQETCGYGKLPVPSQDGFQFYVAKRCELPIKTVSMKERGWRHCSSLKSIRQTISELEPSGI